MLVSVLVPFFNVEDFIERCAKSLFEQTYPHLEYVFVDDCSTDRSMNKLSEVASRYPEKADSIRESVERKYLDAYPEMKGRYSFHLCESADGMANQK